MRARGCRDLPYDLKVEVVELLKSLAVLVNPRPWGKMFEAMNRRFLRFCLQNDRWRPLPCPGRRLPLAGGRIASAGRSLP